jgi:hypothetical protein
VGLKRTNVIIDDEVLLLARMKGLENLSDFVRKALESFVLDDDDYRVPNPIHEKAKLIAEKMKRDLRAQKTLLDDKEASKIAVTDYQQKRQTAIEQACVTTFLKYRDFARCLPENDVDFDHIDQFNHAVDEISRLAGHEVDSRDVIAVYHQKAGTRAVGSRETGESVYGIRSGLS